MAQMLTKLVKATNVDKNLSKRQVLTEMAQSDGQKLTEWLKFPQEATGVLTMERINQGIIKQKCNRFSLTQY